MDFLVVSASQDAGSEDLTVAGLAQSVERLTAEREVAGSISRGRTNTQGLKMTEK